jgi:biotin synthase-related radical SAM superfamily protein
MTKSEIAIKKAELINHGKINIPKGMALPFYPSKSTAGPGAGRRALVFGFSGTRVKLSLARDGSAKFTLTKKETDQKNKSGNQGINEPDVAIRECIQGKPYAIMKNGEIFLENVSLEPTLMHAPNQAFINLTSKCIYDCSFCVTPELDLSDKTPTPERWIELILNHANNSNLESVSITSGVAGSPHDTVLDIVKVIKGVRERLPEIPIGVEPYITSEDDIDLIFSSGATEVKINLETPNQEIFDKVCKGLDYRGIKRVLEYSVTVFGKNKVCSNLIVGLGESDQEILAAVKVLAEKGIVATLRGIRVNDINRTKLNKALGFTPEPVPPERLVKLAEKQKKILEKYGLSTIEFKTMCHRCKCCDIVPQQDV